MATKPDLSTPEARDFWMAVFLAVIALPDEGFRDAVTAADDAVDELLARVKG